MSTIEFRLRDRHPDDDGFVISSWLKSAGQAWDSLRFDDASRFQGVSVDKLTHIPHRFTRTAVVEILERRGTKTLVACDPEDDTLIYGYCVAQLGSRVLHWVHVKHPFRRQGVASDLLDATLPGWEHGFTATYMGRSWHEFVSKWPVRFDPHAGR